MKKLSILSVIFLSFLFAGCPSDNEQPETDETIITVDTTKVEGTVIDTTKLQIEEVNQDSE